MKGSSPTLPAKGIVGVCINAGVGKRGEGGEVDRQSLPASLIYRNTVAWIENGLLGVAMRTMAVVCVRRKDDHRLIFDVLCGKHPAIWLCSNRQLAEETLRRFSPDETTLYVYADSPMEAEYWQNWLRQTGRTVEAIL